MTVSRRYHHRSTAGATLRGALASACGLLGVAGAAAQATEVDTAILSYTEKDRIIGFESIVDARHEFGDGKSGHARFTFDALTGSSASGATPASFAQTFTKPSGRGNYVVEAGRTPLDATFGDFRFALLTGLTIPLNRVTEGSVGLYTSGEHDYKSGSLSLGLSRASARRNTTVAVRTAFFYDTINPEGGRPIPYASMAPAGWSQPRQAGDGTKTTVDASLNLTQVIDRRTVLHLSYSYSDLHGYQTDPYKILSQVDPATGRPVDHLYENRPRDRVKHALSGRLARHLGRDVVNLAYRYYSDDWGIRSHTADLRYRWNLAGHRFLEPHLRFTTQSAADFYRCFLVSGDALPEHVSADYRLGEMRGITVGLRHGRKLGNGHDADVRFEYYAQLGDSHPAEAVGELRDYDLFPTVHAFILQVGYSLTK